MVWKKVGGKEVDGSPTAVSFLTPQEVPDREKPKQAVEGVVMNRSGDLDNVPPLLFELTVKIQGKI